MNNEFYRAHKQLIDQTAHVVIGFLIVLAGCFAGFGVLPTFVFMMFAAFIREVIQHEGFDLGMGSAWDLLFFAVGGILAGIIC